MPLDAAHLHLIRPMELEVALPKAIKKKKKFLRLSPRRSSSDFINMYRRTLRLAKSAYYWGWNWGFELVRFAACNGAILT